ncbi:unnamed protein product [Cutaneotrichosporon oleaginosum]
MTIHAHPSIMLTLLALAGTALAVLTNITLSPLDAAFTYTPSASSGAWADSGTAAPVRTSEGDTLAVLSLPGMRGATVYGVSVAAAAGERDATTPLPLGPFTYTHTWPAAGAHALRLTGPLALHRAVVTLDLPTRIRTEAFADPVLNPFYALQAGFRPQNGLVPASAWGSATAPDGGPVALAPPAARAVVNVPANTSMAVLSAWSTPTPTELALLIAPVPLWAASLAQMSLYANVTAVVRWHVVLDPAERYRLRITMPGFEDMSDSVMLRDMEFWGAAPGTQPSPSGALARTYATGLPMLAALVLAIV